MKYSYEYKLECINLYRQGKWPETPEGISKKNFHSTIRIWSRIESYNGPEALRHTGSIKVWPPEKKYELVAKVMAGHPVKTVAVIAGIESSMLRSWVRKYREFGYNGLVDKKKGRKRKKQDMSNKSITPNPLTESEREELIRLRAENEYIRTEIAVLKKLEALRHEKMAAAQLKAKKQQSSKNYENKDID